MFRLELKKLVNRKTTGTDRKRANYFSIELVYIIMPAHSKPIRGYILSTFQDIEPGKSLNGNYFVNTQLLNKEAFNMERIKLEHFKPVIARWEDIEENLTCTDCATSCQSACKTSCTVGNVTCDKRKERYPK
jgi:predicted ribosomally synthesized six-cysteine peptide SCIFF